MVICGLAGCTQLPPEPTLTGQVPEFTVLNAAPRIGDVNFSVTAAGHLEGALTLNRQLDTTHPIRVAVVWLEPQFTTFEHEFWSSLLLQADQQLLISTTGAVGVTAFATEVLGPPAAATRVRSATGCIDGEDKQARATIVAFVDTNENGALDLSTGPAVDHVLSSTDFPTVMLGDQQTQNAFSFASCTSVAFGAGSTRFGGDTSRVIQPVFDQPLLDLVSCRREDRFAAEEACGIANDSPAVYFFGERQDALVSVRVSSYRGVSLFVDGLAIDSLAGGWSDPELALGTHHLRADRGGVVAWEATFTFPDRIWVKELRPAGPGSYDLHFQEVAGASDYFAIASRTQTAGGAASPIRFEPGNSPAGTSPISAVGLTANFGALPFRCSTSSALPR